MEQNIKFIGMSLFLSVLLIGCGSSSDNTMITTTTTETGTFVDAPVKGLYYQTATQNGYTDANGSFKYVKGETIEFKLGTLALGEGTASTLMTPYTISDNNDTAINIALLLQNFDGNRSDTNVLDLSKLKDYNFTNDFNLSADPTTIQAKIEAIFADNNFAQYRDDTNNSVLSAIDVKNIMDKYITAVPEITTNLIETTKTTDIEDTTISVETGFTTSWLDNRTLYLVVLDTEDDNNNGQTNDYMIVSWKFENNQMLWYFDGVYNSTINYTLENGVLGFTTSDGDWEKYTVTDVSKLNLEQITTNVAVSWDNMIQSETIFLTKEAAEAKLADLQLNTNTISVNTGFTVEWLNGRTLYQEYINYNEPISPYTFNLNNQTSFLDENVNPAVTRTDAYEALDGMIRIVDGKIYEYTIGSYVNGNPVYNDGVNIYTITSIDNDKIVCNVQIPGSTTVVYFYFSNPN